MIREGDLVNIDVSALKMATMPIQASHLSLVNQIIL